MLLRLIALFTLLYAAIVSCTYAAKVPLFIPNITTDSERQKILISQFNQQGIDVLIFNRFEALNDYLKMSSPPLVISIANLKYTNKEYIPKLEILEQSGRSTFRYGVYSDKDTSIKKNHKYKVGMLQTTPLSNTFNYAKNIIPFSIKRVKAVPKEEDIISLLLFEIVDIIIIRSDMAKSLEKELQITLHKIADTKPISYLTVYAKDGINSKKDLLIISKLKIELLRNLGGGKIKWLR